MADKVYVSPEGEFIVVTSTITAVYVTPQGEFISETAESSGQPPVKRFGGVPHARRVRWMW